MDRENIDNFSKTCEEQLQKYTDEFNNTMGIVSFQSNYKIVDINLIGLAYELKMKYKDLILMHTDVLVPQMHTPAEIINNLSIY